ncbi:MAG: ankyrin repeat domain-containing protein, partial [candidate division Zixibacteria bacterium]|nr:ankyrin repeat domain-containing protein [candidate division Zixibacteria bacterium]
MTRKTLALIVVAAQLIAVQLLALEIHQAVETGNVEQIRTLLEANPELVNERDTAQNLPLHLAATTGQVAVIELLLSKGADIEAGDRENTTPLTVAAMLNKPEAVRLLVEKGASITARDNNGNTPLLAAARSGNVETVKYLVEHGASLADVSNRGSNCLHIAASIGAEPLVQYLLDKHLDITALNGGGYSPLGFAAQNGHLSIMRLLLSAGANVDQPDGSGLSPLMQAAYGGRLEIAEALLDLGADVNHAPSIHGHSPLFAAIWGGNLEVVNLLINRGGNLQYRNSEGEVALHIAAAKGNIPIAEMLLSRGFDINVTDNGGRNPICQAIWGQPDMVRWLIDQGAQVDAMTDSTSGPLQLAAAQGDTSIVRALVTHGARVDCRSANWSSPLNLAVMHGDLATSRILLDAGADPNRTSVIGLITPLHTAAKIGKKDLVELLLDRGAAINTKDSLGRTPFYYAARYAHRPTVAVLKARGAETKGIVESDGAAKELVLPIKEGEAVVWYLGHSGWGIKTRNHFLVFDYWRSDAVPDEPELANGFIDPREIAGLPVTIFSTHEHADHYDTVIFRWKDQIRDINYVFGHRPPDRRDYVYVGPEESQDLPGMKVSAIRSTDAGVGFIVEVDGLTIFHAGDHAAAQPELPPAFTSEIDNIAGRWQKIDLAFMPILGCSIGTPEGVRAGDIYALNKLHPKLFFPQHAIDAEQVYAAFKRLAVEAGVTDSIVCAEHRG